jgi:hypothetical protein
MNIKPAILIVVTSIWVLAPNTSTAQEEIDASDPTKIYTYAGPGIKYTDYTNDQSMTEIRAAGNVGLGANDMVIFELGYGWLADECHSCDTYAAKISR